MLRQGTGDRGAASRKRPSSRKRWQGRPRRFGQERFLILPHPEVAGYFHHKADDYERMAPGHASPAQKAESVRNLIHPS